jgi:hypothetical protein
VVFGHGAQRMENLASLKIVLDAFLHANFNKTIMNNVKVHNSIIPHKMAPSKISGYRYLPT